MGVRVLFLFLTSLALESCRTLRASGKVAHRPDSGELTRQELASAAEHFAASIVEYFRQQEKINPRIAFLPTKNDTTEEIPISVFDGALVRYLQRGNISVVQTKNRSAALDEIAFSQSGVAAEEIEAGSLAVPQYFIKASFTEQAFSQGKRRVLEQNIHIELTRVETQLVIWSDSTAYSKKIKKAGGVGW